MDLRSLFENLWRVVSQDVTIIGGIQGPMLSWVGMTGIITLFLWHGTILLRSLFKLRRILSRVYSSVLPLVEARQQVAKDWLVISTLTKKRAPPNERPDARRDLDDLQALDRTFRAEPALVKEWLSYRKTFAVEQSIWFLEPTVHGQRSATEFFSFEVLCASQLNIRFYRQLPSFLTGIGLLFTFIAILIGLSKLHANGPHIEGIQGLINGLSGKFMTSIVGLACANAFTLLESSIWQRLESQHRTCLSLLDELFPQKAADHHVQTSQAMNGASATVVSPIRSDGTTQLVEIVQQRLSSTVTALTSATQALTALTSKHSPMKLDDLPSEIAHEVQRALRPIMNPLLDAVQDLTCAINSRSSSVQLSQPEIEAMFQALRSHTQEKK